MPADPRLLNVIEVAQRLGVSTRTVWRKAATGEIPAPVRLGALVRWRSDELDAFVAALPNIKA